MYQKIKKHNNPLLNRTGAPVYTWLLTMVHVCFVLNHTCDATVKNMHLNAATGSTYDISPILRFHFWQPFYFNEIDNSFPSDTTEVRGRFVRISENFGHDMTFKMINSSTNKIINRSAVRPADDGKSPNPRADPLTSPEVIKSR